MSMPPRSVPTCPTAKRPFEGPVKTITWLSPKDAPEWFPPPEQALDDPAGLLAAGGDLSPARLLAAYRRGIFPWYSPGQPVLWWSPDPRAVLFPEEFRMSRSLGKTLRNGGFRLSADEDFPAVIDGCAAPRAHSLGTWITPEMREAYLELHRLGRAHSIEARLGGELVGGLYGVRLGGVFFGESMFSRVRDASKVALAHLVALCRRHGIAVIDCQLASRHLESLGARSIPRAQFQTLLEKWASLDVVDWPSGA
jgi:leucyl/phenylalanyl-tRNA---protein transferase